MSMTVALTVKGKALNAKMQAGDGKVPLHLVELVAGAGRSNDLVNLEEVVDPRLNFVFEQKAGQGVHARIRALLTNQGNPHTNPAIPPLVTGFSMQQMGFYAIDPDEGRILYQVYQFEINDQGSGIPYVPAAMERPWTYTPTFIVTLTDEGLLQLTIDPNSLASRQSIWEVIELSANQDPMSGARAHLQEVGEIVGYFPEGVERPETEFPDDGME